MVKAIQPARYDVILAGIIYCCTNGTNPPTPAALPRTRVPAYVRLSPLDFHDSVVNLLAISDVGLCDCP